MDLNGKTVAIIVAAGRGIRAGMDGPKQYVRLGNMSVLAHTITAFQDCNSIDAIQVVIHQADDALYEETLADLLTPSKMLPATYGGKTRQESVRLGLEALEAQAPLKVLIHDAARPFITPTAITNIVDLLDQSRAIMPGLPVVDTLRRPNDTTTIDRENLWQAQTPQGFIFENILQAHRKHAAFQATDDISLAIKEGESYLVGEGDPNNFKITTAKDFHQAKQLLDTRMTVEYRTGHGVDVHAFETGTSVTLCGVNIPHTQKLKGHSDADVGMHALTDALLGAIGAGDIGDHFPPSDPQWKGAASEIFLRKACSLIIEKNGTITHCDVTLICEAPKIGPHRAAMRDALAQILEIDRDRISVKATTTEQLGFTGRREGISAMATATVKLEKL